MIQERKGDAPLPGIGRVLMEIREKAGLSRRQLDRKANIGEAVIGRIERGGAACTTRTLHAWLDACGHDLATLLAAALGGPVAGSSAAPRAKPSTKIKAPVPPLSWDDDGDGGLVATEVIGKEWPATWTYRVKNGHWSLGNKSNPEAGSGIGVDDLHGQEMIDDWRRENMMKLYKS